MARVLLALLVLSALTAFAPAPFPRSDRRRASEEVSLESIQGTWRVASMRRSRSNGKHENYDWHITQIRVQNDGWEFLQNDSVNASYTIAIDSGKRPATIDFFAKGGKRGAASGVGIIRRVGDRVEILYVFGSANRRARSFEPAPDNLWYLILERK